jgi:HJR/Mrr/RecB family endonuclease
MWTEAVQRELSMLHPRQRKDEDKCADLIASRITKGWAFRGQQSIESHKKEVEEIKEEVKKQLRKRIS